MTKFTVSRDVLAPALDLVAKAVERRSTIPILSHLLIEVSGGVLTLTGSDLDTEVSATLSANGGDCETTMPAAMRRDAVKKLPAGAEVMFDVEASATAIVPGRSRFRVQTLPATDYPRITSGELPTRFALPAITLKKIIGAVGFAISTEETRYYLNGIYCHALDAHLVAVATDGHRLARFKTPLPDGAAGMPGVIVPRLAVPLIESLLPEKGDVDIALSVGKIMVQAGARRLTAKLVDGTFPDYQRVVPTGNPNVWTLETDALRATLDRVLTVAEGKSRAVKVTFQPDGPVLFEAKNPDAGSANDELTAETSADVTIETGMNGRYALDLLGALDGKRATFRLADAGSPIVVEPADGEDDGLRPLFVIMPMRVS